MTKEQIEQHIKEKIDEFRKEHPWIKLEQIYVCGGCIASLVNDEEVSDYDVYFKKEMFAETASVSFDTRQDGVLSNTGNAITLSNKIQLITKFSGEPEYVIDKFDFHHTQCCYDCGTGKLHLTDTVEATIKDKALVYTGSEYAVSTLLRIPKYIKRGWSITPVQHMRIIMDVNLNYNLDDSNVLKDQLMGVDLGDFFNSECDIDLSWRDAKVNEGIPLVE